MTWSCRLARAILIALFLLNWYRAATQSFTHDEALYFQFFIDTPLHGLFAGRSPAAGCYGECIADPHYLFTLLMRLCSACFGNSAFSLRLPSVAAGGLFFVSVYRLCRIAFRSAPWLFLAGVLVTAGNPLVLDFMVAARGYGLALALFTYALLQVVICIVRDDSRTPSGFWHGTLVKAGLATSLSVTANHTLAPPCLALTGTLVVWLWRSGKLAPAASFFAPLLSVAYVFLLFSPFLNVFHNFRDTLNVNRLSDDTISGSLRDLIQYSLAHNTGLGGLNSNAGGLELLRLAIGFAAVPCATMAAAWLGWRMISKPDPALAACAAVCATVTLGAALLVTYLHFAFDITMPHDRLGLYFLPLGGFGLVAASALLLQQPAPRRWMGGIHLSSAALVAVFYCLQLNWSHFAVWKYDADTRALLDRIAVRAASNPGPPVVVGGSWYYEPSANFYRVTRHWTWMAPVDRGPSYGAYDFYLLTAEDHGVAAALGLEPVATGSESGASLAAPRTRH